MSFLFSPGYIKTCGCGRFHLPCFPADFMICLGYGTLKVTVLLSREQGGETVTLYDLWLMLRTI